MARAWYYKKVPPIFCSCCLPFYVAIRPLKNCVLISSLVVWLIGALIILGVIFACSVVTCRGVMAALLPFGILLTWIGYMLFHCGWGAQLLDDADQLPVYAPKLHSPVEPVIVGQPLKGETSTLKVNREEVVIPQDDPRKTGFWKFVPDDAWQNKCSRATLQ